MFLGALLAIVLSVSYPRLLPIPPSFDDKWTTQISYRQDNLRRNKLYGITESNAKVYIHELADKVLSFF